MVVDIHTHAFPDAVAERAIPFLEEEGNVKANHNGTVSSLIAAMDAVGVDVSVIASIATKPAQFASILQWSVSIVSSRIVPFASVHPGDPDALEHISQIRAGGLVGVKMHPYYQDFSIDDERMFDIYRAIQSEGLVLLMHTGFDIAYDRIRIADPEKIRRIVDRFPDLKLIASHFGAWQDWDNVAEYLLGEPIYLDTSYSLRFMGDRRVSEFIERHPSEYILFGSDSPWGNPAEDLGVIDSFGLPDDTRRKILCENARTILGLDTTDDMKTNGTRGR